MRNIRLRQPEIQTGLPPVHETRTVWVVIDEDFGLQREAVDYLDSLRALDRRFRSRGTANAIVTTVCEFLRFGAAVGWVAAAVAASGHEESQGASFGTHTALSTRPGRFGHMRNLVKVCRSASAS